MRQIQVPSGGEEGFAGASGAPGEVAMKRTKALFDLLENMDNLLAAARFMYWLDNHDQKEAESGDLSLRQTLDSAASKMEELGFQVCTLDEFMKNVEAMIKSDLSPKIWAERASLEKFR